MKYDSIKKVFGNIVSKRIFLRKVFYVLLNLMFLRTWHVRKAIRKMFKPNEKLQILDAGMGFGQYTYFMAKRFKASDILAVDVKEEQVEDCRYFFTKCGLSNASFDIGDLTKIDLNDKFNFILCVDVMEHIDDDELVFRNFSEALKKSGKLLVNTPSNFGGSDVHDDEDESFIEEHARSGYSKEDITEKLERTGMKVINFKYTYGKFGTIAWRLGIKYPMLIVGVSKILILMLPVYYLFTLWLVLTLNWLDTITKNEEGTGIVVVAEKI